MYPAAADGGLSISVGIMVLLGMNVNDADDVALTMQQLLTLVALLVYLQELEVSIKLNGCLPKKSPCLPSDS